MTHRCWICEKKDATTGEHMIMKAAYDRLIGKIGNGEKAFFNYVKGKKNIPIGSFKNDRLKFEKSICQACNGALTQPYDNEFISFIEKLIKSKQITISRNKLSLSSFDRTNLALYFIKIFGCLIRELRGNITEADWQSLRQSILQGRIFANKIYLSAHRDIAKLAVKGSKTVANYPVFQDDFCCWIIDLDWISFILSYPYPLEKKKYGSQWNLATNVVTLQLGKLT